MAIIFAVLSGIMFGLGLIVAGMADPAKVLAFLDLAGAWNPSLALVMLGAIGVAMLPFALLKKRGKTMLNQALHLSTKRVIDRRLVWGSALFGVGWGLAGICPGPAVVLVGAGSIKGLIFFVAMLVGMAIFDVIERIRNARSIKK